MVRRGGLGGGSIRRDLKKAMDSCGKDLSTVEEIVDDLRSRNGKYARMKRQGLADNVRHVLNARNKKNKRAKEEEDEDDDEGAAGKMKKQRRLDEKEEEKSSCSSSWSEDSGGHISDAINSEKVSPMLNMMNESLRNKYAKMNSSSSAKKPIVAEKNVQVTTDKGMTTTEARVGPTFKDFGGIKNVLRDLDLYILSPLLNPQPVEKIGTKPPSGILFHGPPGCGKTRLANALANEAGVPFYQIDVVSGTSENNIREIFSKAYRTAPCIVFIDEIDAIGSKRENQQREVDKRIVTQLLTCMDGPPPGGDTGGGYVIVIGATNMPDALDPALRRGKRFGREIALKAPDAAARAEILSLVAQRLRLEGSFDMKTIAALTPGFVGADLEELADMAGSICINRIMDSRKLLLSGGDSDDRSWLRQPWSEEELEKLFVTMSDFEEAAKLVKGSLTREGFSTVPDVTWGDVGGLGRQRGELNDYIVRPIKYPEVFEKFGTKLETGFLLYGPPGCGKTLVAKAVANEAGANFIHIKGPEPLSKYVGESERAIRTLFQRARASSPCVIFFDEVDALTTRRGREGDLVVGGLKNQFLAELDGGDRRNVYVIGATNRPDVMDPAFLRPGRFGSLVYVPLPNAEERVSILKSIAKKRPIHPSVDLDAIANKYCQGFSGADLANLMDKAINEATKEKFVDMDLSDCTIKMTHFKQALSLVTPSVSKKQIKHYEKLRKKLQSST